MEAERAYAKRTQHERRLRSVYGMTPKDYEDMLEMQNNKCAVCGSERTAKKRLVVDHDHTTGKVRKLLCDTCNRALGLFKDNPDVLQKASEYLQQFAVMDNPS